MTRREKLTLILLALLILIITATPLLVIQ